MVLALRRSRSKSNTEWLPEKSGGSMCTKWIAKDWNLREFMATKESINITILMIL